MKIDSNICLRVQELFLRFGIKSVSMNDISSALGISKKTLYQWIPNKTVLITSVLEQYVKDEYARIEELKQKATDPIHELILIASHLSDTLKHMTPVAVYDLKKYYPLEWLALERERNKLMRDDISKNLVMGVELQLYRKDLDPDLLSDLYVWMAGYFFSDQLMDKSVDRKALLYIEFIKYHIRGIATKKGALILNKYEHLLNA